MLQVCTKSTWLVGEQIIEPSRDFQSQSPQGFRERKGAEMVGGLGITCLGNCVDTERFKEPGSKSNSPKTAEPRPRRLCFFFIEFEKSKCIIYNIHSTL